MTARWPGAGIALSAVLAAGCTPDPVDAFNEDRVEAICSWYDRCGALEEGGYEDIGDCRSDLAAAAKSEQPDMNCDGFDVAAAETCLAAWDEADCVTPPDLSPCEGICEN